MKFEDSWVVIDAEDSGHGWHAPHLKFACDTESYRNIDPQSVCRQTCECALAHRDLLVVLPLPFLSLPLQRSVAVTSRGFQTAPVQDVYVASRVGDQSRLLQNSSGDGDG